MNDRDVTIGLNLRNSGYNRGILQSAALTRVFSREVNSAGREMRFFDHNSSAIDQNFGRYAKRLELMIDLVGTLGPALVPIAGAAIPAMTGLAAGIGVAAAAGGTLMLAFKGIGDAVSKVNKADINPTTANLKNARIAMEGLTKAGRDMVDALVSFKGEYQNLRNAAQTGLFPGLTKALDDLELRLPEVESFVHKMGKALGELAHEGAQSLAGPQWDAFFKFMEQKAPKAALAMGEATGHLVHALAELTMAFAPLNGSMLSGFVKASESIDKWAAGLAKTKGFQDFVAYLQQTGPMVADLLGSIAMAFAHIAEAAAPVGKATLPLLTTLFDIIGKIADSNLGTPLLGLLALTKAMALFGRVGKLSVVTTTKTLGAEMTLLGPSATRAAASVGFLGTQFAKTGTQAKLMGGQLGLASREMVLLNGRFTAMRTGGMAGLVAFNKSVEGVGKAVPRIAKSLGVLGLVAASTNDKIGASNALVLGAAGLMVGPWTAAAGLAIGGLMDLKKAWGDSGAAADDFTGEIERQTLALNAEGLTKIALSIDQFTGGMKEAGISLAEATAGAATGGDALDAVIAKIDAAQLALNKSFAESPNRDDADFVARNQRITASLQGLRAELLVQGAAVDGQRKKMVAYKAAQKAAAEVDRLAAAAADTHAAAVSKLSDAIDRELTGIKALNGLLSERSATLAYNQSLLDLGKSIKDNGEHWDKTTAKGIANWQALDSVASAAESRLDNLQKRGKDAQAQNFYRQATDDLRDFVKANPEAAAAVRPIIALMTKKFGDNVFANAEADLKKFASHTPKALGSVKQLIDLMRNAGSGHKPLEQVLSALRDFKAAFPDAAHAIDPLIAKLRGVDKVKVKPKITVDTSDAVHRVDLIRHNLLDLNGPKAAGRSMKIKVDEREAISKLDLVKGKAAEVGRIKVKPKVTADTGEAMSHLMSLQSYINSMHGKTITITTVNASVGKRAGGGPIYGVGGPRDDANTVKVSRGEYVMQASAVDHYGPAFMQDVNMRRFADGGSTGPKGGTGAPGGFWGKLLKAILDAGLGPGDTRKLQKEFTAALKQYRKHGWTKDVEEAAHSLAKELRTAMQEQKKAIHDAFHGLEFDLTSGAKSIRDELGSLRQTLREAGGVWDKAMQQHARRIVDLSRKYDRAGVRLDKQQAKLEKMTDFVSQVTGNFNNSGFGTQQGLAGFFAQTTTDTVRANAFSSVLSQLQAMGLSGDAYSQLATSGDLNTAQQLLAGGSGTVAQFIAAIAGKSTALGGLGDNTATVMFGKTVDQQNALITQTQATMDRLQKSVDEQEKVLRNLAGLITNVGTNMPRWAEMGSYDGTYDGVRDAMKGAGKALARNGQAR